MSSLIGKEGEDLAVKILESKGYRILERNYRTKFGEIDIIAKDKKSLVFTEVKYHKNMGYGLPQETVTDEKLHKIQKTAEMYLFEHSICGDWRIDVVAIDPETKKHEIFENVFTLGL